MSRHPMNDAQERREDAALGRALRASQPPVPPLPVDFSAQVWAEVERRGIHPRPVWQVRAPVWLGRVAAVALLLAGVVSLDAAVYQLRSNGALEVLYFGVRLLDGFLAGIPYDLLAATLLTAAVAGWLLRHARFARVPVAWALLLSYGLTGTGGLALAATGVNDLLRDAVLEQTAPEAQETAGTQAAIQPGPIARMMATYFAERAVYQRPHARFRMGRVVSQEGPVARLRSPRGDEFEVRLPAGFQVREGQHVRLIVSPTEGDAAMLTAERAQHCAPAAERYFHHPRMMRGMGPGHMRPGMGPGMGPGHMRPGMGPGHMGPGMRMGPRGMNPGMMGPGDGSAPAGETAPRTY